MVKKKIYEKIWGSGRHPWGFGVKDGQPLPHCPMLGMEAGESPFWVKKRTKKVLLKP